MMIQNLISEVLSADITALNFVDRYGGVVQTALYQSQDKDNKLVTKRLPVSCEVNQADCVQDQRYQNLVPDDSKSSVLYFEVVRGLQNIGPQFPGDRDSSPQRIWIGEVRLICWLNTKKLGISVCNPAASAAAALIYIIRKKLDVRGLPAPFDKGLVNFRVAGEEAKSPAIFNKYDYPKDWNYLFHPFDYLALNIEVEFKGSLCQFDFPVAPELACVDDTKL